MKKKKSKIDEDKGKREEIVKDICGIEYGIYPRYYPGELDKKISPAENYRVYK